MHRQQLFRTLVGHQQTSCRVLTREGDAWRATVASVSKLFPVCADCAGCADSVDVTSPACRA
jgi:hypothetical protein